LKIYGPEGYLVSVDFRVVVARSEKTVEFIIPMLRVPTVGAN
jgi:hypothetical protein